MSAIARKRPMATVDVFTAQPYVGNPVAVVLDGTGLDSAQMLAFTRWSQLSEATFVLPPSEAERARCADYHVRIFSPQGEMAFAGHPTLGTCHAWLAHGGQPRSPTHIVQACGAGLVALQSSNQGLAFAAPPARQRPPPLPAQIDTILEVLGLPAHLVRAQALWDNGTPWLCCLVDSPQTLQQLAPARGRLAALAPIFAQDTGIGLCAFTRGKSWSSAALEVRAFTLSGDEDPVTGSLNACLAQWLMSEHGLQAPYLARQGAQVGRDGWISVTQDANGQIWVGGQTVTCVQGQVLL